MPWKETRVADERKAFIEEFLAGQDTIKELCRRYGISEKTGHKWKNRFMERGIAGLNDKSRAPQSSPNQLDEDTVIRLLGIRAAHPTWGPKKLAILYARAYPNDSAPSESSIYRVLGKAGLIRRRKVRSADAAGAELMRRQIEAKAPNDVWTVDFKGWWYSSGQKCLPLTVRDLHSRFILGIRLMEVTTADEVRKVFERLFSAYGMPKAIRSDNGTPFATVHGLLGLTTLSAWWMSMGIVPDRTDPGKPTQNGSHERMHGDMSREIQGRILGGVDANQAAIDLWVEEYNTVRPHEALGMKTPSDVYARSEKDYLQEDIEWVYPIGFETRKVNKHGYVKLRKRMHMVSSSLRGHTVGLQQQEEDGEYLVWLGEFPLAILDTRLDCLKPMDILQ
jgi:transposase InsO family protein